MIKKPTTNAILAEAEKLDDEAESLKTGIETFRMLRAGMIKDSLEQQKLDAQAVVKLDKQIAGLEDRVAALQASSVALKKLALDVESEGK